MYCPFCSLSFDGSEDGGSCPDCGAETITQGVGKREASAMMMDIMKLGPMPEKEMFY